MEIKIGVMYMSKKRTQSEYIKLACIKHANLYTYDDTIYDGAKCMLSISCPVHGPFEQRADHHLNGRGCIKCRDARMSVTRCKGTDKFIKESLLLHGNKYNYSLSKYGSDKTYEVCIICPKHGEFWQTPASHLAGSGCQICGDERSGGVGGYNTTNANRSKELWLKTNAIVYTIKCYDKDETFFKIGITCKDSIQDRFNCCTTMPYKFEIVDRIDTNLYDAVFIELGLHHINSSFSYNPLLEFNGKTECFWKLK